MLSFKESLEGRTKVDGSAARIKVMVFCSQLTENVKDANGRIVVGANSITQDNRSFLVFRDKNENFRAEN